MIVTCYYRFSGSKHPDGAYDTWMNNLLSTIKTTIVVFCEEEMKDQIIAMRGEKPLVVMIKQLTNAKSAAYIDYWLRDNTRDKERFLHRVEHYIVWNEKLNFVKIASAYVDARTYCWCDIGCFRFSGGLDKYQSWPTGMQLSAIDPGKIYITCVQEFKDTDFLTDPVSRMTRSFEGDCRLSGAIMVAHRLAWQRFHKEYYAMVNAYMKNDMFAGVDQNIMASLYVLQPEMFHLVQPKTGQGDPWFSLQPWFCGVYR